MKASSQATLFELAGAVREYPLHGQADDYVPSVQCGLHKAAPGTERRGAHRLACIDTAFSLPHMVTVDLRLPIPDRPRAPIATAAALSLWPRSTACTSRARRRHKPCRVSDRRAAPHG